MNRPLHNLSWGMLAAALIPGCCPQAAAASDPLPPLLVNRQPVDREEYIFFQQQERAAVIQLAQSRCGLEHGPGFWDRRCAGSTPRALLQKKTTVRVVREKVEQLLFKELGLVETVGHAKFLANLETMNREREAAKARGKVLYGPVRFTELQYYGHWKARLQIQAKEQLQRNRLALTEDALRASHRQNRKLYQTSALSDWEIIRIRSADPAGAPAGEIAATAKQVRTRWKPGLTGSQLLADFAGPRGLLLKSERLTGIDDERLAEFFSDSDIFEKLRSLKPGRVLILPDDAGAGRVVKCLARTPESPQPFEKVRAQVQARLLQQRYTALVTELAAKAEVKVNPAQIELIPVE